MSDASYPRYRIVTDHCNGYTVQIKRFHWGGWTTPWQISSRSTIEDAETELEKYKERIARKIEVVKHLPSDAAPEPPALPCPPAPHTSLWCRIFGHKWLLRENDRWADESNNKHDTFTYQDRKYCDRCGVPNPNWTE